MYILGISSYYHDSAAALLQDGNIIAAAQEERFTRKKHDANFPEHAIRYCLAEAGIKLAQVEHIVFHEKPFLKFERLLESYMMTAPKGFRSFQKAMPVWIKDKLFQKQNLIKALKNISDLPNLKEKLLFSEHHLSHAASAFYPSPFEHAAVITLDGVGEWATGSIAIGHERDLVIIREMHFPDSLGLLYSAFTYYTGFKVNSGEYKLMGLAPYGEAKYTQTILEHIVNVQEDGSFELNQTYFNYVTGLTMTNEAFDQLFGEQKRTPEGKLTQFHMDIAASIQAVTEEIILKIARFTANVSGESKLCLAGGVALNCVANGKLLKSKLFDEIWVQPAAGDAGCALGAALAAYHQHCAGPRMSVTAKQDGMHGSYLGPRYSEHTIKKSLDSIGACYDRHSHEAAIEHIVDALVKGSVVGFMQGRMEFGPRALGGRSIIADPRSTDMQRQLNLKIKYRESFRPFAPAVLAEDAKEWFELEEDQTSPYMLMVAKILEKHRIQMSEKQNALFGIDKLNVPRSSIPAITHVDHSARIQTVSRDTNPYFYDILSRFKAKTGCPILVNTSFNVRGEPIVCTPEDAYRCFMGTEMDLLVVEDYLLYKETQPESLKMNYEHQFQLD